MVKVEIWGMKTLKQTYESAQNYETGEKEKVAQPIRVKAEIEWEAGTPIEDVGHYNNKECVLLTKDEYNALGSATQTDINPLVLKEKLKQVLTIAIDSLGA